MIVCTTIPPEADGTVKRTGYAYDGESISENDRVNADEIIEENSVSIKKQLVACGEPHHPTGSAWRGPSDARRPAGT
jgi:hypothetical protein